MVVMETSTRDQGAAESGTPSALDIEIESASEHKSSSRGQKRSSFMDKGSDEYKRRRERNNLAVKKSRNKSKVKMMQTLERVNKLRAENEMLEAKVQLLTKELNFLKDLFLAHAGGSQNQSLRDVDLSMFTEDSGTGDGTSSSSVKKEKKE